MAKGAPDFAKDVRIYGSYAGTAKLVAVDNAGRIYTLIVGANGQIVALDDEGNLRSVMYGEYDSTLKALQTDASGRLMALLMGTYEGSALPVKCDSQGRLEIVDLYQQNIMADATEAQSWDSPIGSLLSNMNRIRNQIVAITGEAWGTVSHSIDSIWAKFNATDGHAHSGAADGGAQVDHGTLGGLSDLADHPGYLDLSLNRAITGNILLKHNDTDFLSVYGGNEVGVDPFIILSGKNRSTNPGNVRVRTPNAAKNGTNVVLLIAGNTDTPYISAQSHKITDVTDPTAAQDAATKNYVDAAAVARSKMIMAWNDTTGNIPAGWLLCDGTSGTPDLRDRFIVGAGTTYDLGATGGEATHTLTTDEIPSHSHTFTWGLVQVQTGGSSVSNNAGTGQQETTDTTGSGSAHENRPPYHALYWIMRS